MARLVWGPPVPLADYDCSFSLRPPSWDEYSHLFTPDLPLGLGVSSGDRPPAVLLSGFTVFPSDWADVVQIHLYCS